MKRKLVWLSVVIILMSAVMLNAKIVQLKNYGEVFKALTAGETVKMIVHYKQCQLISDNEIVKKVPDAIGGMVLNSFEYFAPMSIRNKHGYISSSKTVLINHPRYGFVMNYAKVRIFDNDKIRIIAQYVDPKTYKIEMDESFFTVIDNGKNKGAAKFFVNR